MSTFPGSPRLLKGAIVGLDPQNPLASVIVFQYNPERMTRRLDARTATGEGADRSEALRFTGPPKETITLKIEVDVTDQLETANPVAVASGINPTLAALEMLIYPKTAAVLKNQTLTLTGMLEIIPVEAPLTLFVWGPTRVLPVRLTSLSITEEAFDTLLNPTRAAVDLTLQVLSYYDLKKSNPGFSLFMAYQVTKEAMATTNIFNSAQNIGASLKIF